MLSVRPSIREDVASVAPRLRKEDREEVLAAGGASVEGSLMEGFLSPDGCYTVVTEEGLPIIMFGTSPHPADDMVGAVWLLATDEIADYRMEFLKRCRPYVDLMQEKYPILMNFTDCRNDVHHRWLRWCGFFFINKVKGFGPEGHPFYEVVRIRKE